MTTSEIKINDFVTITGNAEQYNYGHVIAVTESTITLAYGMKDSPEWMWLRFFGCNQPINKNRVVEVWRKERVSKQGTFEFDGKVCEWHSSEYEWQQIQ